MKDTVKILREFIFYKKFSSFQTILSNFDADICHLLPYCLKYFSNQNEALSNDDLYAFFRMLVTSWLLKVYKSNENIQNLWFNSKTINTNPIHIDKKFIEKWLISSFYYLKEVDENEDLSKNLMNILSKSPESTRENDKSLLYLIIDGTLLFHIKQIAVLEKDVTILTLFAKHRNFQGEDIFYRHHNLSKVIHQEVITREPGKKWKYSETCYRNYKTRDFLSQLCQDAYEKNNGEKAYYNSLLQVLRTLIEFTKPKLLHIIFSWMCRNNLHKKNYEIYFMQICLNMKYEIFDLSIIPHQSILNVLKHFRQRKILPFCGKTILNFIYFLIKSGYSLDELQLQEKNYVKFLSKQFNCSSEFLVRPKTYYRLQESNMTSPLSLCTLLIHNIRKSIKPPFSINLLRLTNPHLPKSLYESLRILNDKNRQFTNIKNSASANSSYRNYKLFNSS